MSDTAYARIDAVVLLGMITIRGDLSEIGKPVKAACGVATPGQRSIATKGDRALAWMSPDELLLVCSHDEVAGLIQKLTDKLGDLHSLVADVSHARAVFDVQGPGAREVLAKLSPQDMSPAAFGAGDFRRTRLAQVPGAFWMTGEDTFRVVCFRSVRDYVHDLLHNAAQAGAEVGVF